MCYTCECVTHVSVFRLGYFCDFANQPMTDYTPYPCPVGHYCPNGTEWATQHGCPAGTYNPSTKLENVTSCTQCDAGRYCSGLGKDVTTGKGTCQNYEHERMIRNCLLVQT